MCRSHLTLCFSDGATGLLTNSLCAHKDTILQPHNLLEVLPKVVLMFRLVLWQGATWANGCSLVGPHNLTTTDKCTRVQHNYVCAVG